MRTSSGPDPLPSPPPDGALEPALHDEARALVEALGAHLARQRRLGRRRTEALADVLPATALPRVAPSGVAHAGAPSPTGPRAAGPSPAGPAPATRPARPTADRARPAPLAAPAAAAGDRPSSGSPGQGDFAFRVARNRELAAACEDLAALRQAVAECRACELCATRKQTVFSDGDGTAGVLFVGEAPGATEDAEGLPFVGPAGQLLTDIIHKGMRLERSKTAIANVLKCRPPGNRQPTAQETALCTPWLDRQVQLLAPRVIVALGRHAANHLLGYAGAAARNLGELRGRVHERQGRRIVATYHPSNLLREPENKKECWKDIQVAMRELGLERRPPSAGA